jgi:hypothetical protein
MPQLNNAQSIQYQFYETEWWASGLFNATEIISNLITCKGSGSFQCREVWLFALY